MENRLAKLLIVVFVFTAALLYLWNKLHDRPATGVRVGVILATSGSADFIGSPEKQVLEILLEQYKTDPSIDPVIEALVIRDSAAKPDQALAAFQELVADSSVVAIIGPSTSGESVLLAEEAEHVGINMPLLSLAASRRVVFRSTQEGEEEAREWIFKFAQNDDLAASRLMRAIVANEHKNVYLLYSDDGFGKSGADVFQAALGNTPSVHLVSSTPFTPQLERPEPLIAAVPAEVEALMIWGTAPGPAILINEARRARPDLQIYLSHGNASEAFVRSAGAACEGAIVVGSRVLLESASLDPAKPVDQAVLSYREFWERNIAAGSPSQFGGYARDALALLVEILQDEEFRSREGVREKLEATKNWPGVTGAFSFSPDDHAGLDERAFETYVISNGRFTPWRPPL